MVGITETTAAGTGRGQSASAAPTPPSAPPARACGDVAEHAAPYGKDTMNPGSESWLAELHTRLISWIWIGAGEDGGAYGRYADDETKKVRDAITEEKALLKGAMLC